MVLIPLVLAAGVHLRTVTFPFSGFDDGMHFLDNPLVTDPCSQPVVEFLKTASIGYPIPVTVLSYVVDYRLVGPTAWWFHAVNVVIHLANVTLVSLLARNLGCSRGMAAVAAAVFAVHPVVVEPVAWVTGRKDLLGALFSLLALAVATRRSSVGLDRRSWGMVASLSLAAMLSKPTTIALPAMVWLVARGAEDKKRTRLILFLMMAVNVAIAVVGVFVCLNQQSLGAVSWTERLADVMAAWALTVERVMWPVNLVPQYYRTEGDPSWGLMGVAGGLAVGVLYWLARSGHGPMRTVFLWAVYAYLPVAGFVGHARWTADSYLYLFLAGFSIGGALWVEKLLDKGSKWLPFSLGIALALALVPVAWVQQNVWRSPDATWRAVAERYPNSAFALREVAVTLHWMGRTKEGDDAFIDLDDKFAGFDGSRVQRAHARAARGDTARAFDLLRTGLDGNDVESAQYYLILVMQRPAGVEPVKEDLAKALQVAWPHFVRHVDEPDLYFRLAEVLEAEGLHRDATEVRRAARELRRP